MISQETKDIIKSRLDLVMHSQCSNIEGKLLYASYITLPNSIEVLLSVDFNFPNKLSAIDYISTIIYKIREQENFYG